MPCITDTSPNLEALPSQCDHLPVPPFSTMILGNRVSANNMKRNADSVCNLEMENTVHGKSSKDLHQPWFWFTLGGGLIVGLFKTGYHYTVLTSQELTMKT